MTTDLDPALPADRAPNAFQRWLAPRRRVVAWVCAGYSSFALAFGGAWVLAPRALPLAAPSDRLLLAVQLAALPAAVLMTMLQGLWRLADTVEAEADVLGGRESRRFRINQRAFTNTVEQTLIFVPMLLALSVRMPAEWTFLLPMLVGFWSVGRLLFWVGYQIEPVYRAIGMDWTSSCAMITAGALAWTVL